MNKGYLSVEFDKKVEGVRKALAEIGATITDKWIVDSPFGYSVYTSFKVNSVNYCSSVCYHKENGLVTYIASHILADALDQETDIVSDEYDDLEDFIRGLGKDD